MPIEIMDLIEGKEIIVYYHLESESSNTNTNSETDLEQLTHTLEYKNGEVRGNIWTKKLGNLIITQREDDTPTPSSGSIDYVTDPLSEKTAKPTVSPTVVPTVVPTSVVIKPTTPSSGDVIITPTAVPTTEAPQTPLVPNTLILLAVLLIAGLFILILIMKRRRKEE